MKAKNILISGATGLIGQHLVPTLEKKGHNVLRLTRNPNKFNDIEWDPNSESIDLSKANQFDAVIHLAGENITSRRWNKSQKEKILKSRERGTRLLSESIAKLPVPPNVLISASGINYYDQDSNESHNEDSPPGKRFLSTVCRRWEEATRPALEANIRVCIMRIGVVLTPDGGALKKMLPPMKLGLGGKIGSGLQRMSWISIDDLVGMIIEALSDQRWEGPINAVADEPVTNKEFTTVLAKLLKRPAILPVPEILIKLLFGQMAEETLLADMPVYSKRIQELGYELTYPSLHKALTHLMK
ncbi:TIGR01777 family oxidoreductase [Verrucomicrobia bacterium]|nr:TIGR01777 family oxidoreductase [Verrucomicrobiota bacterium]